MKKYLLPLAALLLGSASLSAEEVTVKYYGYTLMTDALSDVELFKPTTHEVIENGDGSYTLKKFLNAQSTQCDMDLTFTFDDSGTFTSFTGPFSKKYTASMYLQALGGTMDNYVTSLVSAIDGSDVSFSGQLYYPSMSFYAPVAKVVTLDADSDYKYHVTICAGVPTASVTSVPGANQFNGSIGGATFCADFYMGKQEQSEQPGGDDEGTVTVQYFNDGDTDYMANKEVLASTKSAFLINEDGTYTLKNWQNSGADLTFKLSNTNVSTSPKYETYGKKQISIVSPTIGGYATSSTVIQNPDGGNYEANLTTKDGLQLSVLDYATFNDVVVDIPVLDFTTPLYITKGYCGWELVEDTDEATVYKVMLRTEWKVPNPDYGKDGGINSTMATYAVAGWSIFNFSVAKEPEPELPEGQYMMTYTPYMQESNVIAKKAYEIEVKDANNVVVKNFLDSGYDIPMVFSEPDAVDGQDYYASGTLMPTADYLNGSRIKLPDGATFVANIPTISPQSNPVFYWSGVYGWVRYYKEGDKVKKSIHITFGSTGYYCVDWDMYDGNGNESGIEDVVVDENAPAEWYNLQGVRVSGENLAPGIYIKRQGSKTVKVLVK